MSRMSSSPPGKDGRDQPAAPPPLFSIDSSDPHQELIDRRGLSAQDIAQIDALMAALAHLRRAEQELTDASLRHMQLGQADMRALHFLIAREHTGTLATPGAIAQPLRLSTASPRHPQLGQPDSRRVGFPLAGASAAALAAPGAGAQTLGVSAAATAELRGRLEAAGHVRRGRHPSDRRALVITIEPATRA